MSFSIDICLFFNEICNHVLMYPGKPVLATLNSYQEVHSQLPSYNLLIPFNKLISSLFSSMSAQSLREEKAAFLANSVALCACSSVLYLILNRYLRQLKLIWNTLRAGLENVFLLSFSLLFFVSPTEVSELLDYYISNGSVEYWKRQRILAFSHSNVSYTIYVVLWIINLSERPVWVWFHWVRNSFSFLDFLAIQFATCFLKCSLSVFSPMETFSKSFSKNHIKFSF